MGCSTSSTRPCTRLRLKKAAVALAGGGGDGVVTFADDATLAGDAGEGYLQALDRRAEEALLDLAPAERAEANYRLTSAAIEVRAQVFYPIYDQLPARQPASASRSRRSRRTRTGTWTRWRPGWKRTLPDWRRRLEAVLGGRRGAVRPFPGRGRRRAAGVAVQWRSFERLARTTSAASSPRSRSPVTAPTSRSPSGPSTPTCASRPSHGPLFLRINEGKSEDDVRREAAIVAHAAARGVPTPVPRADAAMGALFARWRGEIVSLFPWVAGRTLARAELTPAHAAAVGTALAQLHLASDGFSGPAPGPLRAARDRRAPGAHRGAGPTRAGAGGRRAGRRSSPGCARSASRTSRWGSSTAICSSTTCSTTTPAR